MPGAFAGACRSPSGPGGVWNFVSSSRPWPSGVAIIASSERTPSSPTMRSTKPPSTVRLALQLESELSEERGRGREVVDHDAHVVHVLDRHALDGGDTTASYASTSTFSSDIAGPYLA